MSIYIYNLVFISVLALLFELVKTRIRTIDTNKIFVIIICIHLIIIQSLRAHTVGTDIPGYIRLYNTMSVSEWTDIFNNRMEFGFCFLVKLITLTKVNIQVYLTILSILIITPVGFTIYRYSAKPYISFYVYITFGFYSASFCTIRQHIAYGIILLTLNSIKERKLFKFFILVILASTIHKSAIIFLPAYFISKIKMNKKNIGLAGFIFAIVFVFRRQIATLAIDYYFDQYEIVVSSSYNWMMLCLMLLIFGMVLYKKVTFYNDNHIYYIFILMSFLLMIIATVTTNAMRVVDYYYIFLILYIPAIFDSLSKKWILVIIGYVFLIFSTLIYLMLFQNSGYNIVPYNFFWEYY